MSQPVMALRGITRRFGPLLANDNVTLEIAPGEIHALVGENGAGKTTLMRILYGLLQPDAGHIEVDGQVRRLASPADARRLGLGMVHQHFLLIEPLTVAENIALGREPRGPFGAFRMGDAARRVEELGRRFGLPLDPAARVAALPVGLQQRVEILKALDGHARVLILDEPTAVLTPQEVDDLFAVLRRMREQGAAIVLITHKLAEVKAIADRVTVLRAGRVVGSDRARALSIEQIAEWMMGHALAPPARRSDRPPGLPKLAVRGLHVRDERGLEAVRGVSFEVRAGEIVGIAGVEGNGQHELFECLAGLRPAASGAIEIGGRAARRPGARAHAALGLAHIPSDRLRRGMVGAMTLAENLVLGRHRDPVIGHGPWLSRRALEAHAVPLLAAYDVRPAEPRQLAARLSGGNQQKLVVARELTRGAVAILAAHPTRGVDLGAVAAIHARLLAERDAGHAVLLLSSELSEILALSDRVLVQFEGRIVLETTPAATDERALGLAMTGRR